MSNKYEYAITDFTNSSGVINTGTLVDFINANQSMTVKCAFIIQTGEMLSLAFHSSIDAEQLSSLNDLISNYKETVVITDMYKYIISDEIKSSTSKNYRDFLTISTSLQTGVYKISYSYMSAQTSTSKVNTIRLLINGVEKIEHIHSFSKNQQWSTFTNFLIEDLTDGVYDITLEYKSSGGQASIQNSKIEIMLVANRS